MRFRLLCSALVLTSLLSFSPASAQMAGDTPLMILRFHDDDLAFQKPLAQAIAELRSVNPGVGLTLLAYSPVKREPQPAEMIWLETWRHLQQVMHAAAYFGVDASRMNYQVTHDSRVKSPEIHIFAH